MVTRAAPPVEEFPNPVLVKVTSRNRSHKATRCSLDQILSGQDALAAPAGP